MIKNLGFALNLNKILRTSKILGNVPIRWEKFTAKYAFSNQKDTIPEQVEEISHVLEQDDDVYLNQNKEIFQNFYKESNQIKIQGYATPDGTQFYTQRKKDIVNPNHFRNTYSGNLNVSSLGIGTYVGSPSEQDDLKMFNAVIESVQSGGVNVIDTSINYRYMKSERTIGAALKYLFNKDNYKREELLVCSKAGYIPEDFDNNINSNSICEPLLQSNSISKDDIVGECHCMHPAFLANQLEQSLNNLGLETLDIYYLQNAAEQQMPLIGEEKFFDKLALAFEFMEKMRETNKIKSYGLATWICFRAKPEETDLYLSLEKVVDLAQKIGGDNNGFKYVQLPINIMMPEAFSEKWQNIQQKNEEGNICEEKVQFLRAARLLKINVITSSPLMQGAMMQVPLPTDVFKLPYVSAKHLQFIRSIPSEALLTTLIGQKTSQHVKKNLQTITQPPLPTEEFWKFLVPPRQREEVPETKVEYE